MDKTYTDVIIFLLPVRHSFITFSSLQILLYSKMYIMEILDSEVVFLNVTEWLSNKIL
jgi:hypothetical protein